MTVSASRLSRELQDKVTAVEWVVQQLSPWVQLQQKYIDEIIEEGNRLQKEQTIGFTSDWSIQYKNEDGKSIIEYYKGRFNK